MEALAEAVGDSLIAIISLPGALYEYQKKPGLRKFLQAQQSSMLN